MIRKDEWERDINSARDAWAASKEVNEYEVYAMACAAYLCSDTFATSGEHWFCADEKTRRMAISSLIMFSFTLAEDSEDPANVRYKSYETNFTRMLSSCQKCAIAYQCCDSDLVAELADGVGIQENRVSSFLQELHRKDRIRLAAEIRKNADFVPNLTEALWSFACMTSTSFVGQTLVEPKLLMEKQASAANLGACPGFLLLSFTANAQIRRLALNHLNGSGCVQRYAQVWADQPLKCGKMFSAGVKRNFKAEYRADMAWYTASVILNIFAETAGVLRDIVQECVSNLQAPGLGSAKFGAHALVLKIMRVNSEASGDYVSKESLEKILDYVTTSKNLKYGSVDAEAPEAAQLSESYRKLSATSVLEWFKLYLGSDPDPQKLPLRMSFLLQLNEEAFATEAEFHSVGRSVVKAAAIHCTDQIVTMALDTHGARVAKSFADLRSDSVIRLWKYQLKTEGTWFKFWDELLRNPSFVPKSVSSKRYNGAIIGILQGSRDVAVKFQLPKSHEMKASKNFQDSYKPSPSESYVQSLLDSLTETAESEQLLPILLDKYVLRSVLLLSVSGNRGLSLAAVEFMKQAADEDSREALDHYLVKEHTELTLGAVNWLLAEASPASNTWLAAMPGLLRLALNILDEVYSTHDGVDTTGNLPTLKLLHQFWEHSWSVVANVIKSIRTWAKDYAVSHVKSVLTVVLEFGQGLLSKFRLLDADLNSGMPGDNLWSASLADSAISCINNMGDMLQLAIPDLLAMAVSIIVEILGLIRSFKVTIPDTLLSLLEDLATKRLNSRLTKEQLRDLLSAANIADDEITAMIESKVSRRHHDSASLSDAASPFRAKTVGNRQQQTSLGDYFKSTGGQKPLAPPRQIVNSQVVPQSQYRPSALSTIKSQLSRQQHETTTALKSGGVSANPIGVVHPGRPPGFNVPKPQKSQEDSSSDDEVAEEGGSALAALGAKRQEDALAKMREAYSQNKSSPGISRLEIPQMVTENSGQMQRKLQMMNEQRAKAMMKKRLESKPTELHKVMLSWDFYATKSPFQVASSIPDTFSSVKQYQDIMAPLLYREAWEQVQNGKEELEKSKVEPFLLVFGKQVKVDGFTDVYVSVSKESFAAAGLGEGDLLLLTYDKGRPGEPVRSSASLPHCFSRIIEGSIKRFNNSARGHYVDFQIRMNEQTKVISSLSSGTMVSGITLGNTRTVEREFTALMALPYYDLLDPILKARPAIVRSQSNEIERLQKSMNLNRSQATAVARATGSQGFNLIQGPPGTGKTKTILGIIGAFFTSNALVAQTTGQATRTRKILVCAPSNAAVDEIVLRLKSGVIDTTGEHRNLNILRLGRLEMISEQVRDVTLDELVDKEIKGSAEPADQQLRKDHTALTAERDQIRKQLKDAEDRSLDAEAIQECRDKLKELGRKIREKNYALDMQRDRLEQAKRSRDLQFRQQQNDILQKAQVVCTTLSASAHPLLASLGVTFDTVIIDEAAQSIELSSLIPLKYGCENCIMVGDPNQLPPTVISREASRLKYDQSLFVRMFNQYKDTPDAISMLDTQFRMHPDIARFPSDEFYSGKLQNGEGLEEKLDRPWHHAHRALGPYTFFEIKGEHERGGSKSLQNVAEASAAIDLVNYIRETYSDVGTIGVISPYREQVRLMRRMFSSSQDTEKTSLVDFNSIDGFQGQEKDIIIISCVRASDARVNHIGFLSDVRRMNVALTRAKTSLWILGHSRSLAVNSVWAKLIEDADDRERLVPSHSGNIVRAIKAFDDPSRSRGSKEASHMPKGRPSSGVTKNVSPAEPSKSQKPTTNVSKGWDGHQEHSVETNGSSRDTNATSALDPASAVNADQASGPSGAKRSDAVVQEPDKRISKKRKKAPDSVFIQPRQRRGPGRKPPPH